MQMKLIITRKVFQLPSFRKRGYLDWLVNDPLGPDYGNEWDKNLNQTVVAYPNITTTKSNQFQGSLK